MRPARMPSGHVKVLPWYYTERNQPTRAEDNGAAIADDITANEPHDCERDCSGGTDWRAQAYEDNYWAERDMRPIEAIVTTWDPETLRLFDAAIEQINARRDEERVDVQARIHQE